jgi:type I restriction enzyme S subunit
MQEVMNGSLDVRKYSLWRAYPNYKDSGIDWLGRVPEHWEAKRIKNIFKVFNGSTPSSNVIEYWYGDIVWVTPEDLGNLNTDSLTESNRRISEEGYRSCGTTLVPKGSLLLSTRAPIGNLAIAGVDLCTNQGCRSLVFRGPNTGRYFFYFLSAARQELESFGQGSTFKELSKSKLEVVLLVYPSIPEQHSIALFLDRETSKIDALIAKKEQLIRMLEEKRTALISHTVTKGLDPDVPMRDSGIEWIGEIPEHWDVKRFKYVLLLSRGVDLPAESFVDGPYPVCGSNGVIGYHDNYTTVGPSITVGRSGSVGEVNYVDGNFWAHNTALYVVKFYDAVPRFSYYLLLSIDLKSLSDGSAVGTLNRNYIHDLFIAVPPIKEQQAIASYLDRETSKLYSLISKIREHIARLREYRTALISAAVTGKIDVRERTV